jgi:hypothetical protein
LGFLFAGAGSPGSRRRRNPVKFQVPNSKFQIPGC